jgi:hypothetical protein
MAFTVSPFSQSEFAATSVFPDHWLTNRFFREEDAASVAEVSCLLSLIYGA